MNQNMIAGHLGADPEVRFTSSGKKVTILRVAARARKNETIWWRVSVWGEEFDKMIPYFKKGSPIIVMGEMNKPEIFTDRDGRPQISMSMTASSLMFSPFGRPDSQSAEHSPHTQGAPLQEAPYAGIPEPAYGQGKGPASFAEDEIPF